MDVKEKYYEMLRKKNLRITEPRKALIEILQDNHLTFKEIQTALAKRGFNNVSTVYNNIDFLLEEKVAVELYINGVKYYDLAIDNPMHNADSHVHVLIKDTNEIVEINNPTIFEYIKKCSELEHLDVDYIRIAIGAKKRS